MLKFFIIKSNLDKFKKLMAPNGFTFFLPLEQSFGSMLVFEGVYYLVHFWGFNFALDFQPTKIGSFP